MSSITSARETVEQTRPRIVTQRRRRTYGRYVGPTLRYALLIPLALLFLFPFYLIVRNALMTQPEITGQVWQWWPDKPQWDNVNVLFDQAPMARGLRNSAIIAGVNLIFQTLFASMAGYALARIPSRGSNLAFFVILSTLMVPSAVTFVPSYVVVSYLGGVNTLWGIVVPGLFNAFATFLFRQFYLDFPVEIEEAGRLDGLGYFGIYRGLILPNSLGIMMALGILSFIYSWNAFLWPLVIGRYPTTSTVQIVLSTFLTAQTINLPMLFMGAAVGALPLVVIFLVMQRYIVQGVRLSGIKG
ncbi:MAG: multiple sugar transport system permease protein [Thermomicrobiales bacterium]|jgi:multiple sugar transport system permease protein|nr:multiple sugar transport system permease protein [Thermomicrobiales bacterium]MEA2523963.1 multiple sugar transport system permease protein [Thermomicrobiales bacterium]